MSKGGNSRKHWFRFYFERFLLGTSHMNDREVGAYIRALIEQFDKGAIPSPHSALKIPKVREKFHVLDGPVMDPSLTDGGTTAVQWWINDVMASERAFKLKTTELLSESGRKGGLASSLAKASLKPGSSNKEKIREEKIIVVDNTSILPVQNVVTSISLIKPFDEKKQNEKWAQAAWNDQRWREVLCMKEKSLITPDTFEVRLRAFLYQLEIDKKVHPDVFEFMRHFPHWLRKQSPLEAAEGTDKMRGYDAEAIIEERVRAEDLPWARSNRTKALKLRDTGINDFVS